MSKTEEVVKFWTRVGRSVAAAAAALLGLWLAWMLAIAWSLNVSHVIAGWAAFVAARAEWKRSKHQDRDHAHG